MKDDSQLVADALAGGPQAFAPILEKYQDAVFGVVLARVKNFHDAEDVAQRVFLEAFQRLETLKDSTRLGGWLRTLAIHKSIDLLRLKNQIMDIEKVPEPAAGPTPERNELREQVLAAISKLSPPQRETVMLFYINGYSLEEVATMQGNPVGTVKSRLHDARTKLKEEMLQMVETVLKSEAPKDDFAQRVFDLISGTISWPKRVEGLRKIGPEGFDGYFRAYQSPNSKVRTMTIHMLQYHNAPDQGEAAIELLKKALSDSNKKVRAYAMWGFLGLGVSEERKQKEFVPLLFPLLKDPSKRVRRHVLAALGRFPQAVPVKLVAALMIREKDPKLQIAGKRLLQQILNTE